MKKFIKRKEKCGKCGKKHLRIFTKATLKQLLRQHDKCN